MIPRSVYASLPPVIEVGDQKEDALNEVKNEVVLDVAKKMIVVHSKDVSSEERKIFQFWGRVVIWDDRYVNIPFEKLPEADYYFLDMRLKQARAALATVNYAKYNMVCYVPWWHKGEKFISQLEALALTKFPLRAISKEDFDTQLLSEKIEKPSLARSFIGWLVPCLQA